MASRRVKQRRRVAQDPRPGVLACPAVGHADVQHALKSALGGLVSQHGVNSWSHARVLRAQAEVCQRAEGVEGVAGVVVTFERAARPARSRGNQPLHLGMGQHLGAGGSDLGRFLRQVEQVDQRPVARPRFGGVQEPGERGVHRQEFRNRSRKVAKTQRIHKFLATLRLGVSQMVYVHQRVQSSSQFSGSSPARFSARRARSVTHLLGCFLGPKSTQVLPV